MDFKFINYLPENWLHALGATLFHSLWLGVILAVVSGIIMFSTRKSTAVNRYNLLTASLGLFVVVMAFIFCKELGISVKAAASGQGAVQLSLAEQLSGRQLSVTAKTDLSASIDRLHALWNMYNYQIVLIWFLVICIKSIRLLVGVNTIYHLRNNQVYAAGHKWDQKLEKLAATLGVRSSVKVMQSGIARVPMVVGHFKPLILIPLGLLNGLSTVEVEAILSHELAHIKRKDYLVNFMQNFIEIVFFFNPAVLWVSTLIKTEREHCCDDLAVTCINDRKNYVKALIFCEEFNRTTPELAMAMSGKKNNLLHRASRMLFDTQSTLNKMEKTILTLALVCVVLCSAAFKNTGAAKNIIKKQFSTVITTLQERTDTQDTTKKSKAAKKNLAVNNLEKEISDKIRAMDEQMIKNDKALQIADKQQHLDDAKYAEHLKRYAEEQKRYAADAAQYAKDAIKYAEEAKRYSADGKRLPVPPTPPVVPHISYPAVPNTPPTPPVAPTAPVAPLSTMPPVPPIPPVDINTEAGTATGQTKTVTTVSVTNGDGVDYTRQINRELLNDGLIKGTNKLSYKLDKNNFIVNDVKQSPAIHRKYKEKYLKRDDRSLLYNFEVETTKK